LDEVLQTRGKNGEEGEDELRGGKLLVTAFTVYLTVNAYTKTRPETRVVIAGSPPFRHTVLIEEVISTTEPISLLPAKNRENQQLTHRFLPSLFLRIVEITPSLAKRSWMPFTSGFLSGLHTKSYNHC